MKFYPSLWGQGTWTEPSGIVSQNNRFLFYVVSIRYLVTAIRKVTNTESWFQRSRVATVTKPDHVILKPLELVCGRNWEDFGVAG
jgi:hypothetical protein